MKFLTNIMSLLPRCVLRWVGIFLGFLWVDVLKIRKKIIIDNLNRAFPEKTEKEKEQIGRRSVYKMAINFMDIFVLSRLSHQWIEKNVVIHGWEHIEKARQMNRGLYLLGIHMGSGDLSASIISMKGLPLYLITKRFKSQWLDNLWFSLRGIQGVKYIEAYGGKAQTAFDILKAIKDRAAVVFVLDQFTGPPYGIKTHFFGHTTGTAYGLALFYLKTQSPVVPVYSYESPDKKIHLCFDPPLELNGLIGDDKEKNVLNLTQMFNDRLEDIIRRHPDEWLWVHRRWKDFRE